MAKKRHKRVIAGLAIFWSIVLGLQFYNMEAGGFDATLLESSARLKVADSGSTLSFTPSPDTARVGRIFYPGALVEPEAYAPLARAVAEAGYRTVIIKLPWRLAPFERHHKELFKRTLALMARHPHTRWVVGGHSKGGKLATLFAGAHPLAASGLLLVGTSHPRRMDLSSLSMDVTKVYGSEDGLASEAEVKQFANNLPDHTHWVRITGGNHRQFGWYGYQFGDSEAHISRERQQQLTTATALEQLQRIQ